MDTKVNKFKLLKQFSDLKSIGSAGLLCLIAVAFTMNRFELWQNIALGAVGVFSIAFFYNKLSYYASVYEDSLSNTHTARILKRTTHKSRAKYEIEYDYEGKTIKSDFRAFKRSVLDKKLYGAEEVEIAVVSENPKVFFIPEVINS